MRHARISALLAILLAIPLLALEEFDWSTAASVVPGVDILTLELTEPRLLKVSVARIDTKANSFYFRTTPRAPEDEWGKPMKGYPELLVRTLRAKTRDFLKDSRSRGDNMVLAVNTSGWRPWKAPWNHREACSLGLIVRDGVLVCPAAPKGSWCFTEYKDGSLDLRLFMPEDDLSNVRTCAAGFACILNDGNILANSGNDLHPRTGFGLSKDATRLYLVTVDGRQRDYSQGVNLQELADILKAAGAWKGLNMDGGGSTTLISWDEAKQAVRKWNHHRNDAERTVGCNLGICIAPRPEDVKAQQKPPKQEQAALPKP